MCFKTPKLRSLTSQIIIFGASYTLSRYDIEFYPLQRLEFGPILPAVTPLALVALWLAFSAVTPQHYYDAPPTNGKAPRAPLAIAVLACEV